MADPIEIKETEFAKSWAKDRTLHSLISATEEQTDVMKLIAKASNISDDALSNLSKNARVASANIAEAGKTDKQISEQKRRREEESSYGRKRADAEYKEGIQNLRGSLNSISSFNAEKLFGKAQDGTTFLAGRLEQAGNAGGKFSTASTVASKALGILNGAVTVAAFGFGAFAGLSKTYLSLVDTGITFGGSLEDFAIAANKSGLGIEGFTNNLKAHSATVSQLGDQQYATNIRTFRDMAKASNYYGMLPEQLAEVQGAYLDQLSQSGTLQGLKVGELNTLTDEYMKSLNGLTKLTGKQASTIQKEQAAALAASKINLQIELVRRTKGDKAAAELSNRYANLVETIGEKAAQVVFQQSQGMPITREQAADVVPTGLFDPLKELSAAMIKGPEAFEEAKQKYGKEVANLPIERIQAAMQQATLGGKGIGFEFLNEQMIKAQQQAGVGGRAAGGLATGATAMVDTTVKNYIDTVSSVKNAEGDLAAATLEVAKKMNIFSKMMENSAAAATKAEELAGKTAGFMGRNPELTTGLAVAGVTTAALGAQALMNKAGSAAWTGAKNMFSKAAPVVEEALVPAAESVAAPIAETAATVAAPIAETAATAAGATTLGGLALPALAAGAGGLGVYEGVKALGGGTTREGRIEAIGASAASGAAIGAGIGAIFGGVGAAPGALIGGILGGGAAFVDNLLTAPKEPVSAIPDTAPPTAPQDPILTVLNQLVDQMKQVASNTGTLLDEFTEATTVDQNHSRKLITAINNQ